MALQDLQRDLLQDEEFAEVRAFLAEHNLRPDDERAILAAVRDRGWELRIDGMTGDWTVEIQEYRAPTQSQVAVAHESDRRRALLRALRMALSWLTPEQERAAFDRQTRELLGMGADEFIRKWEAGELSPDEPRVQYLVMLRPLGW
jgi:hypothetical protein